MSRTALVTGVAGQDGVYLSRHLLREGTHVVGTARPGSPAAEAMAPYLSGVTVVDHDLRDTSGFADLVDTFRPDEVYNLGAFSSVGQSWQQPVLSEEVNGAAVERMLDVLAGRPGIAFLQASTSELGGTAQDSPYAVGKRRAQSATLVARERGMTACSCVMFNHESPLRGRHFVTRKITRAAAEIARGRRTRLTLGNLQVTRDWGHAGDYVTAMPLILRAEEPQDVVLATGVAHTLDDLLRRAFSAAGLDDPWEYVETDPTLVRPQDTDTLVGDPRATEEALGWAPRTTFEELVDEMVAVDLQRVSSGVEESPGYLGEGGA